MRKLLLLATAAVLLAAAPAKADILDDPLHGICTGCTDNGTNTPLIGSTFGFASSPPGATGVLWLDVLVPNNTNLGTFLIPSITGFASGTPNLFSVTSWTSGTLNAYLGGSFAGGSPDNNLTAYLPTTQGLDPGATGFFDFEFLVGAIGGSGLGGTGDPLVDSFTLGGNLPDGAYIVAMMLTTDNQGNPVVINTANSAALLVTPFASEVPIPGAALLFGSGMAGLGLLIAKGKKKA